MANLILRNPHSVLAVLETRPQDVIQINHPQMGESDAWARVLKLAREKRVRIETARPQKSNDRVGAGPSRADRDALGPRDGRESLSEAQVRPREGISAEELFNGAADRKGGKGLWLALDSLQDPHNVGAVFRAASFFGVQGILLTQERSASLTGTVYDIACGGVEYVPFTIQTNLQRAFEIAKDKGLWILGTSEHAKQSYLKVEPDSPWLLVVGNEEKGMRRLTEESCDVTCSIPHLGQQGSVSSLNVSVATGILISRFSSI